MKNIAVLLLICLTNYSHSQSGKGITKFIITEAYSNGVDISKQCFDRGQVIIFYNTSSGDLAMSNNSEKIKQQSYGRLYSMYGKPVFILPANPPITEWPGEIYLWRWNYNNNYNSKTGWAEIMLVKVFKQQGTTFSMRIELTDLSVLEYKGYVQGSLKVP